MSQGETPTDNKTASGSRLIRGAIWVAIGALIASALLGVVWLLVDDQEGIIGRAFLTILLLAAFAGIAILEAGAAPRRADWFALASMITWIVSLLVGMVKIWLPEHSPYFGLGIERFFQLLFVVAVLQLALLHVRVFTPAWKRYITTFTTVVYYTTLGLLVLLTGLLVFYLTFPDSFPFEEMYWKVVLAVAILTFVGTALIPLLNVLFAPKKRHAPPQPFPAGSVPAWPTYADGVTSLPALPDGSPDWNAYYTGFPSGTPQPQAVAPSPSFAAPSYPAPVNPEPAGAVSFPPPATGAAPYAPAFPSPPAVPSPPAPLTPPPTGPAEDASPVPPLPHDTPPAPGAFPPPPPAPPK